jgi:hypothetical protein
MKKAVDMGSGAMIYVPAFIKFDSGIQKLMEEDEHTYTHIVRRIRKPNSLFSKQGNYANKNVTCALLQFCSFFNS